VDHRGALLGPEESGLLPLSGGSWTGFLWVTITLTRWLGGCGEWLGPASTKLLVGCICWVGCFPGGCVLAWCVVIVGLVFLPVF
jgi:hypothetical protein